MKDSIVCLVLSSSKNLYGSKTMHFDEKTPHVLSSSKNLYGSKTNAIQVSADNLLSSSKNLYGSKTSNLFYHIIEILTTIHNMKLSFLCSPMYTKYSISHPIYSELPIT